MVLKFKNQKGSNWNLKNCKMAPKQDVDSDIHDYSTFCGKFRLVLQRIQSLWMKILLFAVNAGVIALVLWSVFSAPKSEISLTKSNANFEFLPSPSLLASPALHETFDEATGSYIFNGSIFRGISCSIIQDNKSLVKSIQIVDSIIADATFLGTSLTGMTNLESIVIEIYDVNGTFPRVHLPSLQSFNFTLRKRGAKAEDFKSPEILKQILFFDKQQSSWDIFELFNTGVSVSIWISGTVLIETSAGQQPGLVNIDTPNCQELLTKGSATLEIQGTRKLIMSWCPLTNVTAVPQSVEYLSLNNAVPTPVDRLSSLLTRLDNLQELHIYLPFLNYDQGSPSFYVTPKEPERQNQVDLTKVSPKLVTLSVVRAGLKWDSAKDPTTTNGTSIQELAVQEANITSQVISNFARVFPKLNSFRLFNASGMPDSVDTKELLSSVLALSSVNSVVVTEYRGGKTSSIDEDVNGLPTGIEHFSMDRIPGSSSWTTTVLNETQVEQLRFDHLKFTDVYRRPPAAAASSGGAGSARFGLIGTCWLQVVVVIGVTVVWNCGFDKISRREKG